MPKKRIDPGTSGVMELLEVSDGAPPSSFCTGPKRVFSIHLLLLMAQEHPIFGQQFFFGGKNAVR